jgi:hypothetical protein
MSPQLRKGVGVVLWRGDDMAKVLTPWTCEALEKIQPQILSVHAGPKRMAASLEATTKRLRELVPDHELHLGIGCDYWVKAAAKKRISVTRAIAGLCRSIDLVKEVNAKGAILDLESAAKYDSLVASEIVYGVIEQFRTKAPEIVLGASAYSEPNQHADDKDGDYDDDDRVGEYPWRSLYKDTWIKWHVTQPYPVPEDGSDAPPGALARKIARHRKSWRIALREGWVSDDVHVDTYFQVYRTPTVDLVVGGLQFERVYGWGAPELPHGRMDSRGVDALIALSRLERMGLRSPEGVKTFQSNAGLVVDGVVGKKTLGALGIQHLE